jgi:hypothetical protein
MPRRIGTAPAEAAIERLTGDLDRAGAAEACAAVVGIDAILREALLHHRWRRLGEAALELDELTPPDRWLAACNALAAHTPRVVDRLRRAHQHLLWVAAA